MTPSLAAIPEIDCTEQDLLDAINAHTGPFVVRGLANVWPAAQLGDDPKACIGYLESFAVDRPVTALRTDADQQGKIGYSSDFSGFNFEAERKPLGAFLNDLRRQLDAPTPKDGLYLGSTNIDHWLPGFRAINGFSSLDTMDPLVSLWLGTKSHISAHFDFPSNLATVIFGERQFTLYPPDMVGNLHVGPMERTPAGQPISLTDSDYPHDDRYPGLEVALEHALQATLGPGDAIYIPSLWWHEIKSRAPLNGLVNYWWRANPAYFGSPFTALQHLTFVLRSLPKAERERWRPIIEHYIFGPEEVVAGHIPDTARGILESPNQEEATLFKRFVANQLSPGNHSS